VRLSRGHRRVWTPQSVLPGAADHTISGVVPRWFLHTAGERCPRLAALLRAPARTPPARRRPLSDSVQVYYAERCGAPPVVQLDSSAESAPDLPATPGPYRRSFCLDSQGAIQAIAGIVIALIALLTSYDHISLPAGTALQLPQQWGIWFIVASMALVLVDAQLATGSRSRERDRAVRAAQDAARAAQDAARAEDEAARERDRATEERERAARRARRQDRCALAQFEFQLNANAATRQRLADLISLLREYGEFA
jgi:hypothetical protein